MTYATLMVHLEVGRSNVGLSLWVAGHLADRFHASVVGIAACHPMQLAYAESYVSGDMVKEDFEARGKEIQGAEAEFRFQAFQGRTNSLEWRSLLTLDPLSDYLAHEARSADLVITSVDANNSAFDTSRGACQDVRRSRGCGLGRPVAHCPENGRRRSASSASSSAGKTARETRRAIVDALPLLKTAAFRDRRRNRHRNTKGTRLPPASR